MSSARIPADRPRRLVLVQGGLDEAHIQDGGPDWQDFCHRIGWQAPAQEIPDDFEARLAARLFAKPTSENNVVRLDLVRAARDAQHPFPRDARGTGDAAEADFATESEAFSLRVAAGDRAFDRLPAGRAGVTFAAAAAAFVVAAAVFFLIARLAVSGAPSRSASFPAASAEAAPWATVAPSDHDVDSAPVEAPLPAEITPSRRAPSREQKASNPAPGPRTPPPAVPAVPGPPGARVARSRLDEAIPGRDLEVARSGDSVSEEGPLAEMEASPREPRQTGIESRSFADLVAPAAIGADSSPSWGGAVASYRGNLPTADTVALASPPPRTSTGVRADSVDVTGAPDVTVARPSSASWSLSPTKERWIGASWTPPPPAGTAQASLGVMVQLDLGQALGKL